MTQQARERDAMMHRLRAQLADESPIREVSMFGGRSIMLRDKMIVSAMRNGDLLVRVDAAIHDDCLARPGATQAEMGAGRDMGPGWVSVEAADIADDASLRFWLDLALDYNRSVTGRGS